MAGQADTIINAILGDIESGALNPGDSIDEVGLAKRLGVSRTPLREAMIQLETAGLITRLPRKGAVVFKPTLEEFLAILEVHAKLEGHAASLAARRLSADHATQLEASVRACEIHAASKGDTDPEGYHLLNLRFHEVVAVAGGNQFLSEMTQTNARKLMAYYRARYTYVGATATSAREHREVADLIAARDATAAEASMTRHVHFNQITAMDLLAALG